MMSVDEAESLSKAFGRYRALIVELEKPFRRFSFYAEKRFGGKTLNNCIAMLPSIELAMAFTMVLERRGHNTLLLKLGEGEYTAFLIRCSKRSFIFDNLLVRVFKRGGIVIPKTVDYYTPLALFRNESWKEFELYELPAVRGECSDLAYINATPARRKDFQEIAKLKYYLEASKEYRRILEKSGQSIDEIFSRLLVQ
jgi:hypothetical protein